MNKYVELYLVIVLVGLLYYRPGFLGVFANTMLGKLSLLVAIMYLAHFHGVSSGVLGAFIGILLIHNVLEGVDETLETPKDDDETNEKEANDDETNEEEANGETNGMDEDKDMNENGNDTHKASDRLENEASLKSDLVSSIEPADGEPVGVAMDSKLEGFSLMG